MKKLDAKFKLWLNTKKGQGALGDGKWKLLKTIENKGSLAEACSSLRISYRKAWGDIRKMEDALNIILVEKHRGGNKGGTSSLTAHGKKLVKAYSNFHNETEKAVKKAYNRHIVSLIK